MKRQAPLQTCPPLMVTSGTVNYMQANPNELYSQGTTATLSCPTGSVTGAMTTTCTSGTWQPPIGSCGGAIGVSNPLGIGSFSPSPSVPMGLGTSPLGVPGSTGTTGALQCLDMLTPMNGQIKYGETGLHPSGSRATLSCSPGYMAQGQNEATCTNGVWVPAAMGMCSMSSSGMTPIIPPSAAMA
ncbi:unnamed protein product, partial [Mesorhabditis belari]|uniref:Sushi domain-containing protein n=1 Tax=Mesorhabditis belari TaxID=2138241 RepID=A0AAF3EDK5_9BILA